MSLQFVCFGFHPRGLVYGLAGPLANALGPRPLQVMMHEIWTGGSLSSPPRQRVLGFLQKRMIIALLGKLRPRVIHTQADHHIEMLGRAGIAAQKLPLFPNIPVRPLDSAFEALALLGKQGWPKLRENRDAYWIFCHFGTLHPEFEPEPLMNVIKRRAEERGKKCLFLFVGKVGGEGEGVIARLRTAYGGWSEYFVTGACEGTTVSAYLNASDFALTAGIPELIEKSSSTAVALAHGLPLLVARHSLRWKGFCPKLPTDTHLLCLDRFHEFPNMAKRSPTTSGVADVADRFLASLETNS